jgi:hypoxanthine phosphoribosyltransferase
MLAAAFADSGLTLKSLGALMSGRGAASVAYCCLFDKKARRVHTIPALAYVGFPCPDEFIVGYGIDYAERYRSLPYVGAVKRSVYEKK